jgi:hypothetical protein
MTSTGRISAAWRAAIRISRQGIVTLLQSLVGGKYG